jgi:hypothetical protein
MQMNQHHVVRGINLPLRRYVHFGLAKDDSVYAIVIWPMKKQKN